MNINKNTFDSFQNAYELSVHLEKDYNISSLLIDPPMKVYKNETLYKLLSNTTNRLCKDDRPFIVQKTNLVSEPDLILQYYGIYKRKDIHFFTEWFTKNKITEYDTFLSNLVRDIHTTHMILNDPKYFKLRHDFQVIVNATGHVHQLDLERIWEAPKTIEYNNTVTRLPLLELVENQFKAAINLLKKNQKMTL